MGLVVSVFILQLSGNLVLRAHRVRAAVIARLEQNFGRRVEVQSFAVSLFPLPSLDAEAVTVGEDPAFGNEYFLRADRLSARLRLLGLLRGRLEFGTLSLDHPSLILVKNAEGRWNLERWLPPASPETRGSSAAKSPYAAANRLAKIEITDGRMNFKLGDDKKPFAFTNVKGSVEQTAFGRWQINLKAQPWRSGVQLQTTGTIEVHGEVAGTSARLRPAHLQIRWARASLADVIRLTRGQDEGVRGLFDLDATAESGTKNTRADAPPGEWSFSFSARATEIHRWDITQRAENPRLALQAKGRWLPSDGNIDVDELVLSGPKSNLRGKAGLSTVPQTNFFVSLDSAGIQASDVLVWYRAFAPGVADGVSVDQYFTGGVALHGWPIRLDAAAFSSQGGVLNLPGRKSPLRIGPARGGMEKSAFVVDPLQIAWAEVAEAKADGAKRPQPQKPRTPAVSSTSMTLTFRYDFDAKEGSVGIAGVTDSAQDLFKSTAAFGKQLNRGWDWAGGLNANLQRNWGNEATAGWNGQVEFQKGELQIAGLNQPVNVKSANLRWQHGLKTATLLFVEALGADWDGEISENSPAVSMGSEAPRWHFKLHSTSLTAADLDRWVGPRARPNWLQRLLPAVLGGKSGQPPDASEFLRSVNAEGELSLDEFNLEKLIFKQVQSGVTLRNLHLQLHDSQAQWASGTLQGALDANFDATPTYDLRLRTSGINLAQLPLAGKISERFAGTLSGNLALKTEGVGREVLLDKLSGEGRVQLKKLDFRGWDVQASMASGTPHTGSSQWTDGEGMFHVSGRSVEVNYLLLRSPQEQVSLKGSIGFGRNADLTLGSSPSGKVKSPRPERVMQISGPLDGPKVAIQTINAQQPGD
ncbi:MAG: hypothetical protein NVS9B14_13540 [Candidatus Acidiferrum sp.]